jgi:hypothetical protein
MVTGVLAEVPVRLVTLVVRADQVTPETTVRVALAVTVARLVTPATLVTLAIRAVPVVAVAVAVRT